MHNHLFSTLVVAFMVSLASAVSQESTISIYAWPTANAKPRNFAQISYTSTNASVKSYSPLRSPPDAGPVRIGFYHSDGRVSSIATAPSNFDPQKSRKVMIHLNSNDEVFHVGFKAVDVSLDRKSKKEKDLLGAQVVKMQRGLAPHLNKPVELDAEGKLPEKEPEKSFIQK